MKQSTFLQYVFLLLVMSFFISCKENHYRVTAIKAFAVKETSSKEYEEVKENVIESLTVKVECAYKLVSEENSSKGSTRPMYAGFDPPEDVLDNNIIFDETELMLNKDVYYKGELIEKGTNLRMHSDMKNHIWLKHLTPKKRHEKPFAIGFDKQFYEDINIPEDEYTITIICHTDDELKLESTIVKTIKLKK